MGVECVSSSREVELRGSPRINGARGSRELRVRVRWEFCCVGGEGKGCRREGCFTQMGVRKRNSGALRHTHERRIALKAFCCVRVAACGAVGSFMYSLNATTPHCHSGVALVLFSRDAGREETFSHRRVMSHQLTCDGSAVCIRIFLIVL